MLKVTFFCTVQCVKLERNKGNRSCDVGEDLQMVRRKCRWEHAIGTGGGGWLSRDLEGGMLELEQADKTDP